MILVTFSESQREGKHFPTPLLASSFPSRDNTKLKVLFPFLLHSPGSQDGRINAIIMETGSGHLS
jgi:hypothetical protein